MLKLITQDGLSEYDAWNHSSELLVQLSKSFAYTFINNAYLAYLYQHQKDNPNSTNNQKALEELLELYLLYGILEVNTSWLLRVEETNEIIS